MSAPPEPTRWAAISESNAIDARAKLAECIEALDHGDLRFAAELCQSAASELRSASVFSYVDRHERRGDLEPGRGPLRARQTGGYTSLTGPQLLTVKPADSITVLRLPNALLNCLTNASIDTVGDLLERSERDLWRCRGIGQKSVARIKSRLSLAGLSLRDPAGPS